MASMDVQRDLEDRPPTSSPAEAARAGLGISWKAVDRPMAAADIVEAQVASLSGLDLHELRIRWRKLFRASAPPHLPRYLLVRVIAYRIQANVYGDLDRETARYLDRIAKEYRKRRNAGQILSARQPPPIPPVPVPRSLKPGTILAREHAGAMHRVMVVEGGFSWNGAEYQSLSEVARAITGTNWNGPRFFGLRDREELRRRAPAGAQETIR